MRTVLKIGVIILVLIAVAFAAAFGVSRYLVSKLDGQGQVPPQGKLAQYSSEDGFSFTYPVTYSLSSHPAQNPADGDVLVLVPKGATVPEAGEGPPTITVTVIRSPALTLEQWIRTDSRSNFALSDGQLAQTTVGGVNAYQYQHSGLYETDAFAVAYDEKILLLEAGWLTPSDSIRLDFQRLVSSVHLTN